MASIKFSGTGAATSVRVPTTGVVVEATGAAVVAIGGTAAVGAGETVTREALAVDPGEATSRRVLDDESQAGYTLCMSVHASP